MTTDSCILCDAPCHSKPVVGEEGNFCCHGCQAVYQILKQKEELEERRSHPLFEEALEKGIISNPYIQKEREAPAGESQRSLLELEGLFCPSCADLITYFFEKKEGVQKIACDYATDLLLVEYDPMRVSEKELIDALKRWGYGAKRLEDETAQKEVKLLSRKVLLLSFLALNAMMFAAPLYAQLFLSNFELSLSAFAWVSFGIGTAVLGLMVPFFKRALLGLRVGVVGMEALVSMSLAAAYALSTWQLLRGGVHYYFDSMAVIAALVFVGKQMESFSKKSAKEMLYSLSRHLPKRARVKRTGAWNFVSIKEVALGEKILIQQGEQVVLDGNVLEGEGYLNESSVTGESLPRFVKKGDSVKAGTTLQKGSLTLEVTSDAAHSTLHFLVEAVAESLSQKKESRSLTDRLAALFTIGVISVALTLLLAFTWLGHWQEGTERFLALLLIACPCTLGIAEPLVTSRLALLAGSMGVLVKNRKALSKLARVEEVYFDKTGTLTKGEFRVVSGLEGLTNEELSTLKALAERSSHPLSEALVKEIAEEAIPLSDFEEVPGRGVKAQIQNQKVLLGSRPFLSLEGVTVEAPATVYFYMGQLRPIQLEDPLREEASELIDSLPLPVHLLSGDQRTTCEKVAKELGITEIHAECHPLEKRESVVNANKPVLFVGDGVNDSVALAAAEVSLSLSHASEMAMVSSDLVLLDGQLTTIEKLRQLSKRAKKIAHQNLFWSFFYNALALPLALFGFLSPLASAFAMVVSSSLVTYNSSRLKLSDSSSLFRRE